MSPCLLILAMLFICPQFICAQDNYSTLRMSPSMADDIEARSVLVTNKTSGTAQFAAISPSALKYLRIGQYFTSVTNVLGVPPVIERSIDFNHIQKKIPGTNSWAVAYMDSQSDRVFYSLLFSGENGRPARLLTVKTFELFEGEARFVGELTLQAEEQKR